MRFHDHKKPNTLRALEKTFADIMCYCALPEGEHTRMLASKGFEELGNLLHAALSNDELQQWVEEFDEYIRGGINSPRSKHGKEPIPTISDILSDIAALVEVGLPSNSGDQIELRNMCMKLYQHIMHIRDTVEEDIRYQELTVLEPRRRLLHG